MIVRARYSKLGRIRFTSQRDVARMWERALRRAGVPVAYTEGFAPRPKLAFGMALPTCGESLCEFIDIALEGAAAGEWPPEPDRLREALSGRLSGLLPDGLEILAAEADPPRSLQEDVGSGEWLLGVSGAGRSQVEAAVAEVLAAGSLTVERERKGKAVVDDVRPAIRWISVGDHDLLPTGVAWEPARTVLATELALRPRGVRPGEFVRVLADRLPDRTQTLALERVLRTKQWIEVGEDRSEMMPVANAPFGPPAARNAERIA